MANTLIITLKMEADAQSFFEKKRIAYFPRHCNYVPAHITYFHAAPNNKFFIDSLKEAALQSEVIMDAESVLPFANGLAYALHNDQLQILHKGLQEKFLEEFTGKDKKPWKPHITIQNKVTEFKAQKSYEELLQIFKPFSFKIEGFNGYVYANKKWSYSFFIPFAKL